MANGEKKPINWGLIIQGAIFVAGISGTFAVSQAKISNLEARCAAIEAEQKSTNYELILYRIDEINTKMDALGNQFNTYVLDR